MALTRVFPRQITSLKLARPNELLAPQSCGLLMSRRGSRLEGAASLVLSSEVAGIQRETLGEELEAKTRNSSRAAETKPGHLALVCSHSLACCFVLLWLLLAFLVSTVWCCQLSGQTAKQKPFAISLIELKRRKS